jgi:crossover junction endodeoxyribonuclease RuvC
MFLACQYNIELYLYSPASIKKIVSGSGKADKEIIVNTINNYFNIELNVKNDNDKADAIAIALSYLFDRKKSKII